MQPWPTMECRIKSITYIFTTTCKAEIMTIIRMSVTNCALGLFLTGAAVLVVAPGYAQSQKIVMEEMMVPSSDPDIEIYVRNKHPADMTAFRPDRTVLYVHGATYPASTAFDLQLGGTSWMDYIAARGYDVYLLDLRGYGKSTRPKEMSQPPEANGPIVRGDTASAFHRSRGASWRKPGPVSQRRSAATRSGYAS